MRSPAGSVAGVGAFGLALVVLLAAGRGELAAPPLDGLGPWLEARGPVVAAVVVLRLAALAAAAWVLVVTLVGATAGLLGAASLVAAAQRALPATARRILTGLAGAGAAGVVVLGASGGPASGSAAAPPPTERLVRLPHQAADPPPVETMSVLDAAESAASPPAADDTWVVRPGDSFWSIAEELLADALGRPPSDREVDPHWRRLIEANRDRLATGDPDLLFPGQVLALPGG